MTLPPTLSDLDREPDDDRQLSRVSVLVGDRVIDLGLPTGVSVSVLANEIIDIAAAQAPPSSRAFADADTTEEKWTLARPSGVAIDPDMSLAEAGVFDGELLLVREIAAPSPSVHVDAVEPTPESIGRKLQWRLDQGPRNGWFSLSLVLSVAAVLLLPRLVDTAVISGVPVAATATLFLGLSCATAACVLPFTSGSPETSAGLAIVAFPLVLGGALYLIPGVHGVVALPMALGVTALIAVVLILVDSGGKPLFVGVIANAAIGIPAALAQATLAPTPRALGAIVAATAVVVVYLAPGIAIMATRLPVPRVPTAGEPLDDIEIQGGTAVDGVNALGASSRVVPTEEGMVTRVSRATTYLTGIIGAAAVTAVVGCYLAVDVSRGFYWQGAAFALAVATVLCLRGRTHHDLLQAATLIVGGLVVALTTIVKTAVGVPNWQVNAAILLIGLTVLLVVCGLVAPRVEFSPVMRRWAEVGEYAAIGLIIPLACWIVGVYGFFRGLRL